MYKRQDIARAKKDNAAAGAFYRELAEKFPSSAFVLQRGGYLLRKMCIRDRNSGTTVIALVAV